MAGGALGHRAQLYFHTLRHLKASQLLWRARRRLSVRPAAGAARPLSLRGRQHPFVAAPSRPPVLVAPETFCLLNQTHRVAAASDWNKPDRDALWIYNLHYFDDLCSQGASERMAWHRELIDRWIAENPVGRGRGWDPYPTSLRIVNWIKWAYAGGALDDAANASLASQARHLARNIEWDLLANHLLANAKALVFAGCYFEGPEAQEWLTRGVEILGREVGEQVLPDGGHFERSPMYHAIALEDFLDLVNVLAVHDLESAMSERLRGIVPAMIKWLHSMTHPDGELAYFNDTTPGVATGAEDLVTYAFSLGIATPQPDGSVLLPHSGYVRLEAGPYVALFDAAAIGPDYQPGHGHADTLSFELSVEGKRVLCNSGISTYEIGAQRAFERSTAAHNTVSVDGADSSEVWASFRVARRARPTTAEFQVLPDGVRACASHDGYARLSGSPIHRRELQVSGRHVQWVDTISGHGRHQVRGHIPIHPDASCRLDGESFALDRPGVRMLRGTVTGDVSLRLEQGSYAEGFNLRRERQVLVWAWEGTLPARVQVELSGEHAHPLPD
jgi:uncharacterized heparinase superfamily protein